MIQRDSRAELNRRVIIPITDHLNRGGNVNDKGLQKQTAQEPIEQVPQLPQRRLVGIMAAKFNMEPDKLLPVLKETCFKGATNEQMVALMVIANEYNLNPFTKEIYAFPTKGGGIVPVVGIDGWNRIINEHPSFDGIETEFNESGDECTCTIYRKDRSHPTVITEYLSECKRNTEPWNTAPRRMLRHRAIIQCARVAFSFAGIKDEEDAVKIVQAEVVESRPLPKMPMEKVVVQPEEIPALQEVVSVPRERQPGEDD